MGEYEGEVVASNILGETRRAHYEAVPRVTYTDPQAAAVGADEAPFSGTAALSDVAKTATYTHAYAESNGFLTLLSDGEVLTGAYALGPEAGEWLQQATLAIRARVPLEVLRDTIQPFPSFSEIHAAALKELRRGMVEGTSADHERGGHAMTGSTTEGAMMTATKQSSVAREPALLGQTVVLIGGSAGIGLETARLARGEGADVILTGRDAERLESAARDVDASSTAAFDAYDPASLKAFFDDLSGPIDHVLVTAGSPAYGRLLEMDSDQARWALSEHMVLAIEVARHAATRVPTRRRVAADGRNRWPAHCRRTWGGGRRNGGVARPRGHTGA